MQIYRFEFVHLLILMLSMQEVLQALSVSIYVSFCQGTSSLDAAKTQNMISIVESDGCIRS